MRLSVIVPCYNEERSLDEFHDRLTKLLNNNGISYEIIMIDDGSRDDTYKKIKELNNKDKNVKGISFSKNFGKESAMYAGLSHASGEYITIMDADMQHTPETLLEMYTKLISNPDYDVVCAYKESRRDERPLKRFLTAIYYRIINKISDINLLPGAGDFRVFKKSVKDAILMLPEKTRFLKGIFSWVGYNTIYVPYKPEKRKYGSSKWSIYKLTKYALGGIISFSTIPIKSIFILGLIIFGIGFLNFILLGHLSYKTIILFLSFIMLSLGVISLYVSRIYSNILNRPCFIIKEEIGFKKDKK